MSKYPAYLAGMILTADRLIASQPDIVTKGSTESVTSSTTLQNDDELFLSVEANATYTMELCLFHDSDTGAASDVKIGWSYPSGATMNWGVHGANTAATSSSGVTSTNMQTRIISEVAAFGGGDSTGTTAYVEGVLITSSTAGTFRLQWAQETSNAVASNVRAGSWLKLQRTA